MEEKIDTQARRESGAPFSMDGGWPVFFVRVAEECNRVLRQELTEEEGRLHADLANKPKELELDA